MVKKIIFDVDDQLDEQFRSMVMKKYGFHHGAIKKGCTEAIQDWIRKNTQ